MLSVGAAACCGGDLMTGHSAELVGPPASLQGPNGVVYFGDWYSVVHLLERYFPVRGGQTDNLAAKR